MTGVKVKASGSPANPDADKKPDANEHLVALHPTADRHLAADGGDLLVGIVAFPLLPVAPLPQVDFPTIQVTASLPGASPETMASSVATPLEYQFAADPRRLPDDLDQRPRQHARSRCSSISTATSTPPRRTSRRRSTPPAGSCRRTCPAPPTYRKVNPADSPILIYAVHSDVLPLTAGRRLRRERHLAADLADPRRRPGRRSAASRSRRCASRSIRPRSPRSGMQLEDVASVIDNATVDAPKGSINGHAPQLRHLRQRPAAEGRALERRHRRLRNGAPVRIRDIGVAVDGPENNQLDGLAERQVAASCC